MDFEITITNPNAKDIELKKKENTSQTIITNVIINMDTPDDNVRRKSDAMLAKVKITGVINADTMETVDQLFKWSIESNRDSVYRKVNIQLKENDKDTREYNFEDMFVVDYQENLQKEDNKDSTFTLQLNQKETSSDKIESFAD